MNVAHVAELARPILWSCLLYLFTSVCSVLRDYDL